MSAMLDTPLNGMGVVPLRSTTESLVMSQSYRDALNTLITACSGKHHLNASLIPFRGRSSVLCVSKLSWSLRCLTLMN